VKEKDVVHTSITVDEAVKMVVSGGTMMAPDIKENIRNI
jgi:uncharacterized membrane protein